jgi:DNA polymerase-3 subunit gamma/tau
LGAAREVAQRALCTAYALWVPAARVSRVTVALYRRYRPETFADVIGQEHVTEPLMQALRTGRVNHAYLFSGPRGCGKTTSARILARCLNCEQGPTPDPCGSCDSCVALARGGPGTVDVIEIDAASHGGVDDARDLRERASYGPAQSRYKIYIIDEAHMVTPQGFNALLKIVEEPPEHVKFVFATTEPEKVIGTIRSRTHHYPFRLVPPGQLGDYMQRLCDQERVQVAPGVLSFVVRAGGGSVRDSLSVLDQLIAGSGEEGLTYESAAALLGFTDGELLDASIDAFAAGDAAGVFRAIERVIETGLDPRRFIEDLLERLRDLIVVAAIPDGAAAVLRGVPTDQLDRMRAQSVAFGPGALSRAADIVNAGLTEMTGATAPRLQLELIAARVLLPGAAGESGYAARLDRLERRLDVGGVPTAGQPPTAPAASAPAPAAAAASASMQAQGGVDADGVPAQPPIVAAPQHPDASAAPDATPSTPMPRGPGGLDVAAIRRAWPDVLAKVFELRRTTWTFVSEHAQVLDYDGERLVLGISTSGLTQTFRRGAHADYLRQALIDVLGVEARVEGVPTDGSEGRPGPPGVAPVLPPDPRSAPPEPSPAAPAPRQPSGAVERARALAGSGDPFAAGPARSGGGSHDGPSWAEVPSDPSSAPAWAAAEPDDLDAPPPEEVPLSPLERARLEAATTPDPETHVADDSAVSDDDEDIEDLGDVGVPVVERLLGATIIKDEAT